GAAAAGTLLDKVESPHDLAPWLAQVRPVETLEQALALRASLAMGESLISRDGYWLGRHFLRVRRAAETESGVLARGQELERLYSDRDEREARLAQVEESLEQFRTTQREQEAIRDQQRRQHQDESRRQGEIRAQLLASQTKLEQLSLRRQRLDEELNELAEQRALETEQLGEARLQLQDALDAMALDSEQ